MPSTLQHPRTRLTTSYWPADTSEPVLETTVGGILQEAATASPDWIALVEGTPEPATRRHWTYAELLAEAERVARALLGRFAPGEHLAVWAPNLPEWELLEFGAALAGLVLVTVNPAYRANELAYVLRQSRAVGVFLVPEYRGQRMVTTLESARAGLPNLREALLFTGWDAFLATGSPTQALPVVTPDDVAQIQYTSGTTGFPKGAMLHHRGITNSARLASASAWGCHPVPAGGHPAPVVPHRWVRSGRARGRTEPRQAYPRTGIRAWAGAQPDRDGTGHHGRRCAHDAGGQCWSTRIGTLRDLSVAAGSSALAARPCLPALVRHLERDARRGASSIVYGQTEASPLITQTRLGTIHLQTRQRRVGPANFSGRGQDRGPGKRHNRPAGNGRGDLQPGDFFVMRGYFGMPEATAEAIDAEGWLHTGDLGTMDERGYCRWTAGSRT